MKLRPGSVSILLILCGACLFISGKCTRDRDKEQFTPNDWLAIQRTYPHQRINPEAVENAYAQASRMMASHRSRSTPWNFTGPTNIGGRITDLEVPAGNLQTIYAGAATGGILKTTDGGNTWINLFQDVPVISIGDLAIYPANPNILYAGTGEANSSSYSFWGNGIYKSTDGGATWQHTGLSHSAYIGRIVVDHSNSQRIFAAACGYLFSYNDERGIYRSQDGGQTWQRVLFLTDSTAAIDLVQHPLNPQILYAAMWERTRGLEYRHSFGESSGIWKSSNGGNTWSELVTGLPSGNQVGRIGLAIARSNPEILYAFYDFPDGEVGVYKTVNGGQTWIRTNDGALYGMNSGFGWYFGQIRVDPANPDRVFVLGVPLYRSENGGNSWLDISGDIHVDHHALYIDENSGTLVEGNDGGLYQSENYGNTWTKINNLPITQFYAIEFDFQHPYRIYGGTQDNNTIRTLTGATDDWEPILGGDGMYTLVDHTNSNVIYAEYQWGNLHRSDDGGYTMNYIAGPMSGDRMNWSAPLAMHPVNPGTLYFGTYRVWKTTNKGNSWTPVSPDLTKGIDQYFHTITTIAVSPLNPSVIIAGTGDGKVHVSTDDGGNWTDISGGLPDRWVTHVAGDPFDAQTIYVTLSGFRWDEPLPHVFRSVNLGQTWTDISGNLPEFPVNGLVTDPDIPGKLLVATDAGMYGTLNGGLSWQWIWADLPAVPVIALKVHVPTRMLVAGTYGLSTYSASLDDLLTATGPGMSPQEQKMLISPNPVTQGTTIRFTIPAADRFTLIMRDTKGVSVYSSGPHSMGLGKGTHSIPLPALIRSELFPEGMYLLTFQGEHCSVTGKLIISR